MSVRTPVSDGNVPRPEPRGLPVATVFPYAGQAFVLVVTVVIAHVWEFLYVAAVGQAGLAFLLIARLASRKR